VDSDIKDLTERIINSVNPNWTINEKLRYVYIMVGKELAKDVTFFYSLGKKIGDESYDYSELRGRYIDDKVVDKKVICKSAALILKTIYDVIGVKCDLMQSIDYQNIKNEDDSFDLYHWFLCCRGDDGKKYFLTLVPDLINIQNNWQTEHFASNIDYYNRPRNDVDNPVPNYMGNRIYEDVMEINELEQLDMRIGYLKRKDGKLAPTQLIGNLDINDYIYYENGKKSAGLTQSNSPFVYEQVINIVGGEKGYNKLLAEETEFHKNVFSFVNEKGKTIDFVETPLRDIGIKDIKHWSMLIQERIIDSSFTDDNKISMMQQVDIVCNKLLQIKKMADDIREKKAKLETFGQNPNEFANYNQLQKEIEKLEQTALRSIGAARNILYTVSQKFIDSKYKRKNKKDISSEYIIKRLEKLLPLLLVLNDEHSEPMTARCNGTGEQLALVDTVLNDLFDGNILSRDKTKNRIIRTALYDPDTKTYDLIFQIDKHYYYFLDAKRGTFEAVTDIIGFLSNNNYTILNDQVNERIAEIEKEMSKKTK
jgi:hypothetical protein